MKRAFFFFLGCIFLVVGVIGVVLPLLPGTINLILAAGFFARSSPRIERWMLEHPKLGPPIRSWREEGSISRKHKTIAISMLWVSIIYACFKAPVYGGIAAVLCAIWATWFISTRPTRLPDSLADSCVRKNPVDAC